MLRNIARTLIELPQGRLAYREIGQGPAILFIHGVLVNSEHWRKVVPELSTKYRCILPDLPLGAHVHAMKKEADVSPPGIARLVSDFMDSLDLKDVTIVGNDSGGAISQMVVANHPQRIKSLVLTNCDCYDNFPPKMFFMLPYLPYVPGGMWLLSRLIQIKWVQQTRFLLGWVAKYGIPDDLVKTYFAPMYERADIRYDAGKTLKGISPKCTLEAAKSFGRFNNPVLIVWSPEDKLFPYKYAIKLAKDFPNSTLETVSDSYCFINEDNPAALIEALQRHLTKVYL